MEELQENQRSLGVQADQLRMSYEETRNENMRLKMEQESQNNLIHELQIMLIADPAEKMNALEEKHAQEILERRRDINALRAEMLEREREMDALRAVHAEVLLQRAREIVSQP